MKKNFSGFTLLEVAVTLGIFSLLVLTVGAIIINSLRSRGIIWEQLATQSEGRRVVQQFVNEVRRAVNSSVGAYPIEVARNDEIVFYSNVDTDIGVERIHYFVSGTTLMRGLVEPSGDPPVYVTSTEMAVAVVHDILDNGVPLFTYYGENYSYAATSTLPEPVDLDEIRMVGINLTLEEDPVYSPAAFHIESKAKIRNNKAY